MNSQIFFISDDEDEDGDVAERLDVDPSLVDRVYNRPRMSQLEVILRLFLEKFQEVFGKYWEFCRK